MKINFIVFARMSSSRLKGKMMMPLLNRPLLWYSLESIQALALSNIEIVVATSEEFSDDPIADYCNRNEIKCFRGSLDNAALRMKECLQAYPADYSVRICGDNIFVNHEILVTCIDKIEKEKPDFLTNTIGRTFPYGMSVEIVKNDLYLSSYDSFIGPDDFEHVMPFFYRNERKLNFINVTNNEVPEANGLKLAIDTESDLERVKDILSITTKPHYDISLRELSILYN